MISDGMEIAAAIDEPLETRRVRVSAVVGKGSGLPAMRSTGRAQDAAASLQAGGSEPLQWVAM
jgi:hypothetical protein